MSFTTVRLQNLSYVITKGTTPSNIGESFTNHGIKYIRSEMLTSGKYITGEFLHISPETHSKLKRSQLKAGDILFSMAGQYLGKTAILRDSDVPANTNQAVALIRVNTEVCNREYVYYYLNLPEVINKINTVSGQAAQPNINLKQIGDIEILLPDKERQNKIVSVISLFDSLIDNNQKQIKLLEEAAQRLYKEWFVDLRMPKSLNDINQWRKGRFKDLIKLKSGYAFKSNDFITNGKYKIVTIKNVHDGFFDSEKTDSIANVPRSMPAHCFLHDKDILISLTGNVGRVCLVVGDNYLLNQRVAKIESKYPAFAYFFLRSNKMFVKMNNMANGAAQQNLSPIRLENSEIVIPDYQTISLFNQQAQKIINQIVLSIRKIEYLKEARNRLLPKLMNGEIEL